MNDQDRNLDLALRALSEGRPDSREDDEAWARGVMRRVEAGARKRLSNAPAGGPAGENTEEQLQKGPFPDDLRDDAPIGRASAPIRAQSAAPKETTDDAVAAADNLGAGDERAWEASMATDHNPRRSNDLDTRPPVSQSRPASGALDGLAALARSGPANAPSALEGGAKDDDSGLIDLRGMTQSNDASAATAARTTSDAHADPHDSGKISVAPAGSAAGRTIASTAKAGASSPPAVSSTSAAAVSTHKPAAVIAVPAQPSSKRGPVVWLALGGIAAAAAAGVFWFRSTQTAANAPSSSEAATTKLAAKDTQAASASAPPPRASMVAAEPGPTVAMVPPTPATAATVGGAMPKMMSPTPGAVATATATKPEPPQKEGPKKAGTSDPINKPSGGDLDSVLGIGKGAPTAAPTATAAESNLPDKPDTADVRSAINGRVGSASACVKGLDGSSSVSISFGPGGGVTGVVVTGGPAKGTGAEACIKGAFQAAKVPASKKGATGYATLLP